MTLAKRKPATAKQAEYQDAARNLGCVICRKRGHFQPNHTQIHHRNLGDLHGQKQLGQDSVVAMCAWHHEGDCIEGWTEQMMRDEYGPSFKRHARDFRIWTDDVLPGYGRGTEAWQQYQDELLGVSEPSYAITAKGRSLLEGKE